MRPLIHEHSDGCSGFAELLQQGQHAFEERRLDDTFAEPASFAAQVEFDGVGAQERGMRYL